MELRTFTAATIGEGGDLFAAYFRARHRAFIEERGWTGIPTADGMEFDQYDLPFTRWVVVHDEGRVYGGIRLTPTTARCGLYSYMIRDAQRGLLPGLAEDLLYALAPVSPTIWETSRVFVTSDTPGGQRAKVHALLIKGLMAAAHDAGATHLIGMISPLWRRWQSRYGLPVEAAGPDKGEYQCVWIDLI